MGLAKFAERLACIPAQTVALAVVLALLVGGVAGWKLGIDHVRAQTASDLQAVIDAGNEQDGRTSGVNTATRTEAATAQAQNETATHDAQARIVTVYRDAPVSADCREPAGSVSVIGAEVERANDLVRAGAGAAAARVPDRRDVPRERR